MEYLSDIIGETYKSWNPPKSVIINTPTGSGKTYFVLNVLLKYAAENSKRVVYLTNRNALRNQVEKEVPPKYLKNILIMNYHKFAKLPLPTPPNMIIHPSIPPFSPLQPFSPFVNISTCQASQPFQQSQPAESRQPFNPFLEITLGKTPPAYQYPTIPQPFPNIQHFQPPIPEISSEESSFAVNADYFILDEAHYLLADSDYNDSIVPCTQKIDRVKRYNPHAVWIAMSATPSYFYLWADILKKWDPEYKIYHPNINLYDFYLLRQQKKELQKVNAQYVKLLSVSQDPSLLLFSKENYQNLKLMRHKISDTQHYISELLHNYETYHEATTTYSPYNYLQQLLQFNESALNPNMGSCLYYLARHFNASLIDLAPCNCFDSLHLSPNYYSQVMESYENIIDTVSSQFTSYVRPCDYSYITPVYYNTDSDLLEAIHYTDQNEKWLIFVDSIDEGYTLAELIEKNETGKDSVVFLHRENRNNKKIKSGQAYPEIIKNESFEQRILITTAMLDNGINLKDKRIKNVVIKTIWHTSFFQMLGRRRRQSNDDTIKLYLQNLSEEELKKKFSNQKLRPFLFFNHFIKAQKTFPNQQHPTNQQYWFNNTFMPNGHFEQDYQKFIFFQPSCPETISPSDSMKNVHLLRTYHINPFAFVKITFDSYYLLRILESYRNLRAPQMKEWLQEIIKTHKNATVWTTHIFDTSMTETEFKSVYEEFTKLYQNKEKEVSADLLPWLCTQLTWLGIDYSTDSQFCPFSHAHWYTEILGIHRKKRAVLIDFLEKHEGTLTKADAKELCELVNAYTEKILPTILYKFTPTKNIDKINNRFKELRIPYSLSKIRKRCWEEKEPHVHWVVTKNNTQ